MSDASEPTFVAHYELLNELGRGGMGIVYRAHDRSLDRIVALKRPSDEAADDPEKRRRFLREARAASRLAHPHIVPVHAVLEHEGLPWIVMELVEGRSLRGYIDEHGPLPLAEALRHAEALADALCTAHERGVLHRDVNPKNILLAHDGRALLADFGLARILGSAASDDPTRSMSLSTSDGRVLGTPGYMAPEQILGQAVDARSDIFALGAVLYEMCSGTKAFPGAARGDVAYAILHREPSLESADVAAPQELHQIIRKATAKSPGDRYLSARELVADLRSLRRRLDSDSYVLERAPSAFAALRSRRRVLIALVVALAIVGGGIASRSLFRPAAPFHERDWLLITDFENTTGEKTLDETLREALDVALSQSSYVNVVPRSRVADALRRMRREAAAPVDAATGREISLREGFHMLLGGSIRGSGGAYQILVQASEPQTSRIVLAESERFNDTKELFTRVDALARRVRAGLGESLDRIDRSSRPLEQVTTSSLDALRLYSQAVRLFVAGELKSAVPQLEQSVALDLSFAMAHLRLGRIYSILGDKLKASDSLRRAYELRQHVTDREAALIAAGYAEQQGDFERARDTLKQLTDAHPDDVEAHRSLANQYESLGDVRRAIAEEREVLRLDPFDFRAWGNLGLFLVRANAPRDALTAYDDAARRGVSSLYFAWGSGLARLALGENDRAREDFQKLRAAEPPYRALGQLYLARAAVYEGKFSEALDWIAEGLRDDERTNNLQYRALRLGLRARVLAFKGDRAGTARDLTQLLAADWRALGPYLVTGAGQLLAETRDLARARQALTRLKTAPSAGASPSVVAYTHLVEGEIALAEARLEEALRLLTASAAEYPSYESHRGLARVHEAQGNWSRAADEWRQVLGSQGEILRFGYPADWPLAHLALARVLKRAGQGERSQQHYDAFIRCWRNGDASDVVRRAFGESQNVATLKN